MEEYLIFAAIGGLIFLTLLINSVAEAYEQKQREKRLKILAIKRGLDTISDLLSRLQNCDIGNTVRELLLNEVMARIEAIQSIDRHFGGIQALIEEAGETEQKEKHTSDSDGFAVKDEREFKIKLLALGHLIRLLNSRAWYARVKAEQLTEYARNIKLLRCEKIFQFYADKANIEAQKRKYLVAQENYRYILHILNSSGLNDHPRIIELAEQASFMLKQTVADMTAHMRNLSSKNNNESQAQEDQSGDDVLDKNTEAADVESGSVA